jgi:hypothetical protein
MLDSRHAAVFSVPTLEMTVVPDDSPERKAIENQIPESTGKLLAILYTTESIGSLLTVHALPGLEVIGRVHIPKWSRNIRFDSADNILFTTIGTTGLREVVSANFRTAALRKVARLPESDIHDFVRWQDSEVVVSRKIRFDLSRQNHLGQLSVLTHDGRSGNGSLSPSGMLVIQRALPDGREVIALRNERGAEDIVTAGPSDLTPSFLPDGRSWMYVDFAAGRIVECSVETKRCASIHTDPAMPAYPVADPTGTSIAYITSLNASRVRVISRTAAQEGRREIDLGPALGCGPVWTSADRLWVVTSTSPRETDWAEIDVRLARRTGARKTAASVGGIDQCPFPRDLYGAQRPDRVIPTVAETSDISVISFARQQ